MSSKTAVVNIEAFRNFIMSQQGKGNKVFWTSTHNKKSKDFLRTLCASQFVCSSRGATSSSFRGAIFMKFHWMTSSCLFNCGTTFSQTVTYNNNVFLPADTKSIVQTNTFCTTLVNKNRQNRTFYNSVGD